MLSREAFASAVVSFQYSILPYTMGTLITLIVMSVAVVETHLANSAPSHKDQGTSSNYSFKDPVLQYRHMPRCVIISFADVWSKTGIDFRLCIANHSEGKEEMHQPIELAEKPALIMIISVLSTQQANGGEIWHHELLQKNFPPDFNLQKTFLSFWKEKLFNYSKP